MRLPDGIQRDTEEQCDASSKNVEQDSHAHWLYASMTSVLTLLYIVGMCAVLFFSVT